MTGTVDMHGHVLNQDYAQLLTRHDALTRDGFPLPSFDEQASLAFMDENGIDLQLLTLSSPHPFFGDAAESAAFCQRFNDWTAALVARHPSRFAFCAVVPVPCLGAARAEAARAMDELGAVGIKLPSNASGLYLGDPSLDALFREVDQRGGLVIVHPNRPDPIREGVFSAGPVPLFEFLADTTRAALNMIAHDVPLRFPNAHIVIPHCGSFLPNVVRRIEGAQPILEAAGMLGHIDVAANVSRLLFDLAGDPVPHLLPLLASIAQPGQLLYGSDYPFTNGQIASRNLQGLRAFLTECPELAPHADAIMGGNARRLLATLASARAFPANLT